jgi:hypothetical protein
LNQQRQLAVPCCASGATRQLPAALVLGGVGHGSPRQQVHLGCKPWRHNSNQAAAVALRSTHTRFALPEPHLSSLQTNPGRVVPTSTQDNTFMLCQWCNKATAYSSGTGGCQPRLSQAASAPWVESLGVTTATRLRLLPCAPHTQTQPLRWPPRQGTP